jgi:hypothetical protein
MLPFRANTGRAIINIITSKHPYRVAAVLAIGAAVFMVVANGAVGIIGSEENPVNRLFSGVVLIGIVGSLLVQFRARGMVWVMYATAAALLIVAVYLAISGQGLIPVVALVFGGAWVVAGRLFARVALKP